MIEGDCGRSDLPDSECEIELPRVRLRSSEWSDDRAPEAKGQATGGKETTRREKIDYRGSEGREKFSWSQNQEQRLRGKPVEKIRRRAQVGNNSGYRRVESMAADPSVQGGAIRGESLGKPTKKIQFDMGETLDQMSTLGNKSKYTEKAHCDMGR